MNNTLKVLLVGITISSSVIAINQNTIVNNLKTELDSKQKENKKLTNKLEHSSSDISLLNKKNKKLSKRVVKEINKIISLKDSVDSLDETLKEDQKKLAQKTSTAKRLAREKRWLKKEILKAKRQKKKKQHKPELKNNIYSKKLDISNIETVLLRKRNNGSFVKTTNSKKTDAIKTKFKILRNKITEKGKQKINIFVFNSTNKSLAYNDTIEINFNNEDLDVTSIIKVEREKIEKGDYQVIAYIEGKKVNSSIAFID